MVLGGHHADLQPAPVGGHRVEAESAGGRVAPGSVGAHPAQPPGARDQVLSLEHNMVHCTLCIIHLLVLAMGNGAMIMILTPYLVNVVLQG